MIEHIKSHVIGYVILSLVLPAAGLGFLAYMDARHEARGESKRIELRQIRREKRRLESYQRLAPNSEYSAARVAEIDALEDEIQEIAEELERE